MTSFNQCEYSLKEKEIMTFARTKPHHLFVSALPLLTLFMLTAAWNTVAAQSVFLGEIDLVPYNFSPKNFAECNGQLLSIAQNTALFSLLGTTYGGDGRTTFALPDLRDRAPIEAGQGPGLSNYNQGQTGGEFTHTLTIPELPMHAHALQADTANGTTNRPQNYLQARNTAGIPKYGGTANTTMSVGTLGATGGNQPHNNLQPYLGLKYIIALQGIFPPR
jgi:microcystin-dependent protein